MDMACVMVTVTFCIDTAVRAAVSVYFKAVSDGQVIVATHYASWKGWMAESTEPEVEPATSASEVIGLLAELTRYEFERWKSMR